MAKKIKAETAATETATNAAEGETQTNAAGTETKTEAVKPLSVADQIAALRDCVTGTVTIGSVQLDDDRNFPLETKTLSIAKGKTPEDKVVYMAFVDGIRGELKAALAPAIKSLLEDGLLVLAKAWVIPTKDSLVNFPKIGDNKPKDPTTIEDLSLERADELKSGMNTLKDVFSLYRSAGRKAKDAMRDLAVTLRDIRSGYTKPEFAIFCKMAEGSDVAELLTSKNTLSEFVTVGNMPIELLDMAPEGRTSPKGLVAWVAGMRGELAGLIVDRIKGNAELSETSTGEAVKIVIREHFGEMPEGETADRLAIGEWSAEETLLRMHWDNIQTVDRFFDIADGGLIPFKVEKKHVTSALFGSEGADELVNALCRAFNSYVSPTDKAVADDMKAKTKVLVQNASAFGNWTADEVARHLFNILAGRLDETSEDTLSETSEFCVVVVDKLAGWVDQIQAGTMTAADILANPGAGAKPESEGDAEADADADA